MKREIKFRSAFYAFDGKFSHFSYWGFGVGDAFFTSPGQNNNCERKFEEQFTGLKDKNRKEIYEGDILKTYMKELAEEDKILCVKFSSGAFVIYNPLCCDICRDGYGCIGELGCWGEYEVIGNIHENTELLK